MCLWRVPKDGKTPATGQSIPDDKHTYCCNTKQRKHEQQQQRQQ